MIPGRPPATRSYESLKSRRCVRLCLGVVDGIAMVIHMTRREGRRVVEEAAFVHGYAAGTNTWDIQRLDRVTV